MKWYSTGRRIICALCCGAVIVCGSSAASAADSESVAAEAQEVLSELPASDIESIAIPDEGIADTDVHTETIESGVYTIDNVGTGDSMKVSGSTNKTGKKIILDDKTISDAQRFEIKYIGDGEYRIKSFGGDGYGLSTGSSALKLSKSADSFYIDKNEDDSYSIISADESGDVLSAGKSGVVTADESSGDKQSWTFDSKVTEDEKTALTALASVQKKYPSGTRLGSGYSFNGGYQCMGFGREVFYRTFGQKAAWSYDGSPKSSSDRKKFTKVASSTSYSEKSMRKLIAKASAGDVLQMNAPKIHTMIFVSSDDNGFTVYDANWVGANQVSLRYVKYSAWSSRNSRGICVLRSTEYPAK